MNMIHWAKIDENNIVEMVVVSEISENDPEGYNWCKDVFGGNWIRTSPDGSINKVYACPGYEYREDLGGFVGPKPFNSWILNENTCLWEAPILIPQDEKSYWWNEDSLEWVLVE